MPRRGSSGSFSRAVLVSAGLHVLGLAAVGWSLSGAEVPPRMKSIAVDIVSPPPNVAGEPPAAAPAAETAAPEPEPEAAQPETPAETPPQPVVQPEPTPPTPRKDPAPVPQPKKPEPKKVEKPSQPAKTPPAREADKKARRPQETASETGEKAAETKSARKPVAATGRTPDPSSPGGEGLRIRSPGAECPEPAYCNNVARQVQRYFRRPPESRSDRADVCFQILKSGGTDDIEVHRLRGSLVFKLALMEAVEKAGQQRAFGPLPRDFGDSFSVCVSMEPEGS
jgi:outer membrane biosynthesis protein TonB